MQRSLVGWLVAWLLLASAGSATAQERYYLILFGSGRGPLAPQYSHSFGIFIRALYQPAPPAWRLEPHVISWMPATLQLRVGAFLPEEGINLPYHASLRWALDTEQCVAMWGPCEIEQELYCWAVQQESRLQTGEVRYKAIDFGYPSDRVSNCIHALSSIVGGPRLRAPSLTWGEAATRNIYRLYQPWLLHPERRHDWLLRPLGLEHYPVVRQF